MKLVAGKKSAEAVVRAQEHVGRAALGARQEHTRVIAHLPGRR
ncbi:hypothetical protein [Streptomyces collinus]